LATPWGHQTQSLLGSRYRSSLGTSSLGIGEVAHWLLPWDIRHSLCLAPGIDPPLGKVASGLRLGEADLATPWGHQTQSLLGSRYRSSLGTDGLGLGEAATLATPWGHQTQSLLGSRYRSSLVTSGLGLGKADIGYSLGTSDTVFAWLQV
jgi:hypothetical protein